MGKTYNYKNVMEQHKEHKTTPNAKKKIKYKKDAYASFLYAVGFSYLISPALNFLSSDS